jgi:hypothetical protein
VSKKSKKRAQEKPQQPVRSASWIGARTVVAAALGTIAFALLFGWNGLLPLLTVPLIVGVFLGLMATNLSESLVTGGSVGLLGSILACALYQQQAFIAYLQRTAPAAVADVTGSLWQGFVVPLIQANPVNDPNVGPLLVVLFGVVLTTALSAGTWWVCSKLAPTVDRRWLGLAVLVPLGVLLASTLFVNGSQFVSSISTEPAPKTYAYDGVVNLKTYYLMLGGMNYYDAIITAASGDTRLTGITDGKWNGTWAINSPTRVREPAAFYLWTVAGHFGAPGILWASLLLAIGVWAVWYWALYPAFGQRALSVAFALFPLMVVHMVWYNLFQPDWWAALMLIYSAAFLVRKRFIPAASFALAAALFREVFALYLVVLLTVAAVFWLRKKLAGRDVAALGAAFVVFAAAYAAHYMAEAPYMGNLAGKDSTLANTLSLMGQPLATKFIGPTSYLMFPYGDAVVPAFVLVIVGAVGLFLLLRDSGPARFALSGYLLVFLAFLAIVGASSSYWGQDFSMLAVTGCAVLLAGSDRLRTGARPPEAAAATRGLGSKG